MLDGLFATLNCDRAIIFARVQFALDEDVRALDKTIRDLSESGTKGHYVVPLRFLLPLFVLIFPRFFRGDAELRNGRAVRQLRALRRLPTKPMIVS